MGLASVNLTQLAPKAAVLCQITHVDDYWAVPPILVPIESPLYRDFLLVNNSKTLSYLYHIFIISYPVRPSVCLTQVGVLQRWLNLGSRKQRHAIAHGLYSFLMPKIWAKFQRDHPHRRRQIEVKKV